MCRGSIGAGRPELRTCKAPLGIEADSYAHFCHGQGTNRLVDPDEPSIQVAWRELSLGGWGKGSIPELRDGKAAQRIAQTLLDA